MAVKVAHESDSKTEWHIEISTYGIQGHPLKNLIEVNIDLLLHLLPQQLDHGAEGDFDHYLDTLNAQLGNFSGDGKIVIVFSS